MLKTRYHVFLLSCIIIISLTTACHKKRDKKPAALSVVTATVTTKDVPVYLSALGTVTPFQSVTVKTQINGYLMKVFFKEGQLVKKGDLLAEIDDRPLLAQLTQYEGQLIRDQALLANARVDLKRYAVLYPTGAVSKQTYDTQVGLVKQYEGTVRSDEGQVQAVKVNLIYCHITAPASGLVGLQQVNPGNFVQTSDVNGIVVLNTMQPISVIFSIPEDDLSKVIEAMKSGNKLPAKAYNREQTQVIATGELLTVDNQIDTTTGTVKLRAKFDNSNNNLFPNQFVNVKLQVQTLQKAVVVPNAAVQHGNQTQGDYVFVVNKDNTVNIKKVKVGLVKKETTVIEEGVVPGQSVVVEGADKLVDGTLISVHGSI